MSDEMWEKIYAEESKHREKIERMKNGHKVLDGLKWLIETGKIKEVENMLKEYSKSKPIECLVVI